MESKFPLCFYDLVCDLLEKGTLKLELISLLPIECELSDKNNCQFVIDPESFLTCEDYQKIQEVKKLRDKCNNVIEILRRLSHKLVISQTFIQLMEIVDEKAEKSSKLLKVMEDLKFLKTLNIKIYEEELEIPKEITNRNGVKIIDDIWQQQFKLQQKTTNFNKLWIKSQLGQQKLKLKKISEKIAEQISRVTIDQCVATDACMNVCRFYRQKIKDLDTSIYEMEIEYDNQIEAVETKFQEAVGEKRRLNAMMTQEKNSFDQRQEEIDEYLEMKRKKKDENDLFELHNAKIILIQAWWRGTLVRNHLGRFKAFKKRAKEIRKEFRARRKQNKTGKK